MTKRRTIAEQIEQARRDHMEDVADVASLPQFSPADVRQLNLCQVFHWGPRGFVEAPHYGCLRPCE